MDEQRAYRRRWGALAVLIICLLVLVADNTILNVALRVLSDPDIGLGASQSQLAWAINSYTLVFAGLLFTFGVLGDRWGRRRVLATGLVVFGTASALSAYSQSPEQLILARAVMGFGASMVMPQTRRSSPTCSRPSSADAPSGSGRAPCRGLVRVVRTS